MFLRTISSSDSRFKTVNFHEGLNLIVANRVEASNLGNSRNGTGKTSLVRILRFMFGGNLSEALKSPELEGTKFFLDISLPNDPGRGPAKTTVERAVASSSRIQVTNLFEVNDHREMSVDEWKFLLGIHVFHLPLDISRPTVSQLMAQLIRTEFGKPVKGHSSEPDWETGVKLGFFLGLSPEILGQAGELDKLARQRKTIRSAIKAGAIHHLNLNEADLRSDLASSRRRRDQLDARLRTFQVDEQYAVHQKSADDLSAKIESLNDEALILTRKERELRKALAEEIDDVSQGDLQRKLKRVFEEVGVVLPDVVTRRFSEVESFHRSVVENRRTFLERELFAVPERLKAIAAERSSLDLKRSEVMRLLKDTIALEVFIDSQHQLTQLDGVVVDLERRLESVASMGAIDTTIQIKAAETISSIRSEISERESYLDFPISLFTELGNEIYREEAREREVKLLVSPPTNSGIVRVEPHIAGDASDGIRGVETFLLDIVCLVSGITLGRVPPLLVHDSHLFDAMDHRQVATCLKIGARLATQFDFQYVVTMNSDFLASVGREGNFDPEPYLNEISLTDSSVSGGLFGFAFD